jgi:hypothetical protein
VIAAILLSRFNGRSITDICAMGGITLDDFTSSVAYREIYGLGQQAEAASMILRQLQRRCGPLSTDQQTQIQALPLAELEALAEALLDFQGTADLTAWLCQREG